MNCQKFILRLSILPVKLTLKLSKNNIWEESKEFNYYLHGRTIMELLTCTKDCI